MPHLPRILFVSPDEETLSLLHKVLPVTEHNLLAIPGYSQDYAEIVEYAHASAIEVIISRGGLAEFLQKTQQGSSSPIPIVSLPLSPFDIIEAVQEARRISRRIAFIAFSAMLEYIPIIMKLFDDIDVRMVKRSSPWDCYESIFNALENKAEVIIGDARTVTLCKENNIPVVMLRSGEESIRDAYQTAQYIITARDEAKREARLLKELLNKVGQCVWAVDAQCKVIFNNDSAQRLAGEGSATMVGRPLQTLPFFYGNVGTSVAEEASGTLLTGGGTLRHVVEWQALPHAEIPGGKIVTANVQAQHGTGTAKGHQAQYVLNDIIGSSVAMQRQKARAARYAATDATVLILGPTGSGKELFAHALHSASLRRQEPFVAINLAALPATLIESELFGYVRGAFTDARHGGKQGLFEYAGHGTVFLDEIGELPISLQTRLLRVLQDGEFIRLGDDKKQKAYCRVIAATNKNLEEAVACHQFREDLYYRLNILRLDIPALNERRSDIMELAQYFLKEAALRYGKKGGSISADGLDFLHAHDWKGNVRELKAVIERCVVLCETPDTLLTKDLLEDCLEVSPRQRVSAVRQWDEKTMLAVLQRHGYRLGESAVELGMHRTTLWRKLRKLEERKG